MPKLSGKYLHFKLFIKTIFGDFWGFSILNGCSLKKNISAPSFRRKYFSSFFLLLKVEEKLLDRKIGFGAKIIFYSNLTLKGQWEPVHLTYCLIPLLQIKYLLNLHAFLCSMQ